MATTRTVAEERGMRIRILAAFGASLALILPACGGGKATHPKATAKEADCNGYTVYVANSGPGAKSVSAINSVTKKVFKTIAVDNGPRAIVATHAGDLVLVANHDSGTVTPIDATNTPGTPITVGVHPRGIDVTPNDEYAVVANFGSQFVSVLKLKPSPTLYGKVTLPSNSAGQYGIAAASDNKHAYVVDSITEDVRQIDIINLTPGPKTSIPKPPNSGNPVGIAISGDTAYVTNSSGSSSTSPDPDPIDVVPVPLPTGGPPDAPLTVTQNSVPPPGQVNDGPFTGVAIDQKTNTLYTAMINGKRVSGIRLPNTPFTPSDDIKVGVGALYGIAIGPDETAWVTTSSKASGTNQVVPVELAASPKPKVDPGINVGNTPFGVAIACPRGPASDTTSSTAESTTSTTAAEGTATTKGGTTTTAGQQTQGCSDIGSGGLDGAYGTRSVTGTFAAGDKFSVTATTPSSNATGMKLSFSPTPPNYTGSSNPLTAQINPPPSATLTYIFGQSTTTTLTWTIEPQGSARASWSVNCEPF
jgi:hypothetical protein